MENCAVPDFRLEDIVNPGIVISAEFTAQFFLEIY